MEENKTKCNCESNNACKVDKKALAKDAKDKKHLLDNNKKVNK